MSTNISGKLISIEGIDGCGKDTQVKRISNYLDKKGHEVMIYNFPKYESPIGHCISDALEQPNYSPYALQLLFSADRAQQFQSVISDLSYGKTVLTSRSKWSSYVYAVSRGLPAQWAENIETFIQESDLTFHLDIDVDTSVARTGGRDVLERDKLLLERCRLEYTELANKFSHWITVDGTVSSDFVFAAIVEILTEKYRV